MPSPSPPLIQARDIIHATRSHSGQTNGSARKLAVKALVLAAYDDIAGFPSEVTPWRDAYDFTDTVHVDGILSPVRLTEAGLGIVTTGVGKLAAATTTAAIAASERLDLDETLFLSVGAAGGPTDLSVGSVIVADTIVDWDHKYRVDPTPEDDAIAMNPHTGGTVFALNRKLVEWALEIAREVDLSAGGGRARIESFDPRVVTGTNLCGDELWHGRELARQAEWFVDQYGKGPYRATEMEDAGTTFAMDRFGHLDRYLCIRGISNHDRPAADTSGMESLRSSDFDGGFEIGIQNAVRIAREVVERRIR